MKISQSMIKEWDSHVAGESCGSVFVARYIDRTWDRTWGDSDSKALGRYFEFILTDVRPNGYDSDPEPVWMKSATDKDRESLNRAKMMAPYRLAHDNADRIKLLLAASGISIERSQIHLTKGILEGNIDAEAIYTSHRGGRKRKVNIDIKYSGLMDDKWSKFGWQWTDIQTAYNGIQAAQYQSLNGRPVMFLVVSSSNTEDVALFEMRFTRKQLREHLKRAEQIAENIDMMNEIGWQNYPELKKCSRCPLTGCKDRITKLIPEKINT
jgi:hypothetical protein